MTDTTDRVGFVGLGNMGRPMAANVAKGGYDMIVFDAAGTAERAPPGATVAASMAEVAAQAGTVLLSLPDGAAVASVAAEMVASAASIVATVVDTSTIGVLAARRAQARLAERSIEYVDAPVSGGTAGAAAGSLSVMFAGPEASFRRLKPLLETMAGAVFHVGGAPGQGQAMKVLNNFLSATAMAATSEAVAFGLSQGLDAGLVVDVLNASSGQNTATSDKFPRRILPGKYDAGFTNTLLVKDLSLFLEGVGAAGTADTVARTVVEQWRRFAEAEPDVDFTRIYPFVRGQE